MQYHNIDVDLNDGKTCCLCCGLETGFNVIGCFGFLNAILSGIKFAEALGTGSIQVVAIYGVYCSWNIIYGFSWLLSFIARKKGNS